MKKRSLYLLGLITLLVFPIPTFIVLEYFEGISFFEILELDKLNAYTIGMGGILGAFYAIFALVLISAPVFKKLPNRIDQIVKNMNLSILDCLFLSLCAGIGEEILFRSGVQFYLGPLFTSIFFVAIHGYLNPLNWRMSLYGVVVLPFILLISYGLGEFGLWFCISAHFTYDFILFWIMTEDSNS